MYDGLSVRSHEGESFAVCIESKIRVQFRGDPVFAGSEHDEVLMRLDRHRRELPAREFFQAVGEIPALEVERI